MAKRKRNVYFDHIVLADLMAEARRLDRSLSWLLSLAWKIARGEIGRIPSPPAALHALETTTTAHPVAGSGVGGPGGGPHEP